MKTKFLIIIFLGFGYFSIAQSKKETEDWINLKLNIFPVEYEDGFNIDEDILFDNGTLYYYHAWDRTGSYYNGTWSKLPIKNIQEIKFSKDRALSGGNSWIVLSFFFKENSASNSGDLPYKVDEKSITSYKPNPGHTRIQMRLHNRFKEDDMEKRMEKALLHLIKLYGGNATVQKEPF
jgi:hypothetical protein